VSRLTRIKTIRKIFLSFFVKFVCPKNGATLIHRGNFPLPNVDFLPQKKTHSCHKKSHLRGKKKDNNFDEQTCSLQRPTAS